MAFIGDTIRLKVSFKTFDGTPVDPTDIKLTIYDEQQQEIDNFNIDDTDKLDVGVYFYDYQIPQGDGDLIFEFEGEHNNKPIVCRDKIKRYFIR